MSCKGKTGSDLKNCQERAAYIKSKKMRPGSKSKGATAGPASESKKMRPGSKSKGAKMKSDPKEMKPHNMYGSGGVVKFVKTMKEH